MLSKRKVIAYIIIIMLIALFAFFLYHFREKIGNIIVPFLIAMVIAYLVEPLVLRFERKKFARRTSILIIYFLISLIIVVIVVFVVPEITKNSKELMNTLPDITIRYQNMFNNLMSFISSSNWPQDVKNTIFSEIQNGTVAVQNFVMDALKKSAMTLVRVITTMMDIILAMIIAYYFIKDAAFFRKMALSITPRKWRNSIVGMGREINLILSNFIQGQLLTALIVGVLETLGLYIVKVKYPLVLGSVAGLANIIPYFGPVLGAIPAVAVALTESPAKAFGAAVVFIIVQQLDNAFISPKIIEGRLGLHPVTTILAVLVGGEFFGIIGMLVAVPVTAIIKVLIKRTIEAIV